ncbi:HEAT repeat domain-containing protein [Pedobacter sp. Hv1]|uniref:HEAT repeat domain-containing protein n=1 Tax=Pedobacter sp. Hv1 TaxID=1740090 RepID=UPI0006D8D53E|nr:HEAT repeat domain-containing protein [Pedobacter sp. Hv1]KQC00074.1 hypothetical protein AQF98_13995 [Pedobacter sp. Hv1]
MKGKLEEFIDSESEAFDHRTPNPLVLERIKLQMQGQEPKKPKKVVVISFRALQWSAAACFVLVLGTVFWKMNANNKPEETKIVAKTANKAPQQVTTTSGATLPSNEVAQQPLTKEHRFEDVDQDIANRKVRIKEVFEKTNAPATKQVLFDKLHNQESPATRIHILSGVYQMKNMSKDVVDVLVQTMNNDPNTNVRLAALDGLAKFYRESYVKKQLVNSLKKQQDPMVQIALIGLLTRMKESAILSELEQMVKDQDTMDAVKERAYTSMFELKKT